MYAVYNQTVEHGHIKTVTENNKTGMVLRETISSADNNTYFAYVSSVCKIGNVYKFNCLALKKFPTANYSDYTELGQKNQLYCPDHEIRINAQCRMASLRIINGSLYCELEPENTAIRPRIAKISLTTGQILATKELRDAKPTTLRMKTRDPSWKSGATAHIAELTVQLLVDGNELWLLYESASQSTQSVVEQIKASDLTTVDLKSVTKIDRQKLSMVFMICGKLYVLSSSSVNKTIHIVKSIDIYRAENVMHHRVRLVGNYGANAIINWVHYNPKLEEVFIGALDSNSFVYKVVRCAYNFPDTRQMNLTQLKSTMMWSTEANEPEQITDLVDTLVGYFKSRNVSEMEYLSSNLLVCPPKSCAFDLNKPTTQYCRIRNAISTFKIYTDYKHFSAKSTKLLQVHFHLDSLLNQQSFQYMSTQIFFLREFLSANFMELREKVNTYRTTIGTYFTSLANYDQDTANSDMNLIYTYLGRFKNKTEEITSGLQNKIKVLFDEAAISVGAEIAGKARMIAIALLSFANPIQTILGPAGSVLALDNAIDGLMVATASLTKLLSLKNYLPELKIMIGGMGAKISENHDKYAAIRTLVGSAYNKTLNDTEIRKLSSNFLKEYDSYEPGYLPSSIARIEAMFNQIVDDLCELTFGGETLPSAIAQAVFHGKGNCFKTKLEVKSLMAIFYDMYDNQDNLFDAFRSLVRAQISKHNANRIKKIQNEVNVNQLIWTHVNLKVYTMELFISSEVHRLVQVHDACNLIKYKSADVMPQFCINTIIYTHSLDYAKVASYRYADDMCSSDNIQKFVKVPAIEQLESVTLPNGTLDLISLYKGDEVNFKIPDRQWLINHGWIRSTDNPTMILLKNFELFVPMIQNTSTVTPVTVKTYLKLAGSNKITANGDTYNFNDPNKYVYNYRYNQKVTSCEQAITDNIPYSMPGCTKPPTVCVASAGTVANAKLYPSIYARYYLSMHIDGNLMQPKPKGDFNLIAAVTLCYVNPARVTRKADDQSNSPESEKRDDLQFDNLRSVTCCADSGKYFVQSTQTCGTCPTNSTSKLQGYYCERN